MNKVKLISFGFKYGQPRANYYFDVGFVKNPAREKKWGFHANADDEMCKYVMEQDIAREFVDRVVPLITFLSKIDQNQVFAFGCSAGRHRSTIIVNTISELLKERGIGSDVEHRDLD